MRRLEFATLAIAISLFLGATLPWIQHLGLEYDEAHFLPLATQIAFGAEQRLDPPWGITIANRPIPFMTMPYVGALDSFLYAIPYSIFGTSVAVSRTTNIALGLIILILAFHIAHRESGLWAAALAAALILADVELLLHIPTHFGPFLLQQLLTLAAIACLQHWWRTSAQTTFFLAIALLALAFHEKLTFIWILSALALAILIFEFKCTWSQSRWWFYPLGLLLAIVIVSPILYFVWATPEVILGFGKASAKLPADFNQLLASRWHVFDLMLRGNWTIEFTTGAPPASLSRGPALLILFFVGLLATIFTRQRLALILYTTALGVWLWNFAFPDAGRMHHVLLMAPFWQIAAGIALSQVLPPLRLAACALILWSAFDATRCYAYYDTQVRATGGINHWSDMSTRAYEWLNANPSLDPVTTSWGLARPINTFSGGRINTVEHYFDTLPETLSEDTIRQLKPLIEKERQVWLVSSVMPIYEQQWQRVVALAGRKPLHLKTFHSRNQTQQIAAYTFTPAQPAPAQWVKINSTEFPTPTQLRIQFEGEASQDGEYINIQWLDAAGNIIATDNRNFYWTPHLRSAFAFEFTPTYWPSSFNRQQLNQAPPARIRIESKLNQARITSIEVPAP